VTKTRHRWLIAFTKSGLNDLRLMPSNNRMLVFQKLRALLKSENPLEVSGVKKLKGKSGTYRARSGDYRILFTLDTQPKTHLNVEYKGTVSVQSVKQRKEAYKP
jgi:mRNA-degrading endonuclease RelE of RelBE toxin-antitoxin system